MSETVEHENLMDPDGTPIATQFTEALQATLDRFRSNGLTIAEAVGGIELVKLDLYSEVSANKED